MIIGWLIPVLTMMSILNLVMSINKIRNITQLERQKFCDFYYETFQMVDTIYKVSKTKSGGCPLKTALFLSINENNHKENIVEVLENYIYIFNTGNVSVDDDYGEYVKDMRDIIMFKIVNFLRSTQPVQSH